VSQGFDIGGLDAEPFPPPDWSIAQGLFGMLGAIVAWWSGQPIAGNFSTRDLWLFEAPDEPVPYAVLNQVSEPVKDQTTDYQLVDGTYQISCFAATPEEAYDLARTAREAFHKASIGVSDDQPMHCLGGEVRMVPEAGLGGLGRDVWMAYAEIEILSQR
jgi:hypothetical protein